MVVNDEMHIGARKALVGIALLLFIFLLSLEGLTPPSPKPANAPASEFSARRAFQTLQALLGDESPHPVGSQANNALRNRIISSLKTLGYDPQTQTTFACSEYGNCSVVMNVVAILQGASTAGTSIDLASSVLISAHYDSVPASSGASDDGVGFAAVLEVARALKSLPPAKNPIIILLADGEEGGLLGAHAFVESHPWAGSVRAVVNLDARGTSGVSTMFETGAANDWAVRLFERAAGYPSLTSISYTVYKRLPNDTDFSVFREAGKQGLNFAFIGDQPHYHTPLDNIANVNLRSLQHQGANALAAVRAFANADLSNPPPGEAVYFDLFQHLVIRFRASLAPALAILFLMLIGAETFFLIRTARLHVAQFLWGISIFIAAIVITAIFAFVLRALLRLGSAVTVDWIAHPFPIQLAFWSLAASVVFTLAVVFGHRAQFWGFWTSSWSIWSVLSLLFAFGAAGISYLFLVPSLVASVSAIPALFLERPIRSDRSAATAPQRFTVLSALLPLATAAAVGLPAILLLYEGLGNAVLPYIAVLVAIQLTSMLPLCAGLSAGRNTHSSFFSWIPIGLLVASSFFAVLLPQFSTKSPQRVNIDYWKDADTNTAQWIVEPTSGRLPEPISLAANFQRASKGPFPWNHGPAFHTPAPRSNSSGPSLTVTQSALNGHDRTYRAILRSERGAPEVAVLFPPKSGVKAVSMQGKSLQHSSPKQIFFFGEWNVYRCLATPPDGIEISFTLPSGKPLQLFVVDLSYGLPTEGKFLLDARPLTAVPSQEGDVTMVSRSVQLLP